MLSENIVDKTTDLDTYLVVKSNSEWVKWGKFDPLWAVASWAGREKTGTKPWTNAEFYALGEQDWKDFQTHWIHFGLDRTHCIEIGCGAGRITKPMADSFEKVSALDVSSDQIHYARKHINKPHVEFFQTNGQLLPVKIAPVTAVFSVHVFQHFDDIPDAIELLKRISIIMVPDATLMIHLPLYDLPDMRCKWLLRKIINLYHYLGHMAAIINRKRGKLIMRGLRFDQQSLAGELRKMGFYDIEFRIFITNSNQHWHSFVFARKK